MLFISLDNLDLIDSLPYEVNGIELRLDLFPSIDLNKIQKAIDSSPLPLLLTLRKSSEGGNFQGSEKERMSLIEKLLPLKPHFFDIEYEMDPDFIINQIKNHPEVKFILSYHNFSKTPLDIEELYNKMLFYPAYSYKIATPSSSTNETLSYLLLSKKHPKLSIISMGEKGSFGRILSFTLENKLSYTFHPSKEPSAPGQVSLEDLTKIYRYFNLNTKTALYGLIGDPITKSVGHIYHNDIFTRQNRNALYVKMTVSQDELKDFLSLAKQWKFQGLSVTMPLKEAILPYIDILDPKVEQVGAINTLLFQENQIFGTNTDGIGALDALEKQSSTQGKKVVLIGAGGAARAIAFEAKKRGALLCIVNRTLARAKALASELGCESANLSNTPSTYDILINTSSHLDLPLKILPSALVMDIVYAPKKTPFLEQALALGCKVTYGEEMFTRQADEQAALFKSQTFL